MVQAVHQTSMIQGRRRNLAATEVINIKFDWSDQDWVMAFLPGTDIAVILLHHDREDLERVVAGLLDFRERARFDCDGSDVCTENCR